MGLRSLIAVLVVGLTFGLVACSKDAQKVQPETRGKRGETCLARNDCTTGLACISGVCAKNEFDIDVAAKHCDRIECTADQDCCGEKLLEAPAKCNPRDSICNTPTLPGCTVNAICTDANADVACGEGTCGNGTCSNNFNVCTDATDCADTCVSNGISLVCSSTGFACVTAADCPAGTCNTRRCNCVNPAYMPAAAICEDPDCVDICLLRCEDKLCVQDDSCETDANCLNSGSGQSCDGGRCVQCTQASDCDEDADEKCESGQCRRPCKYNEECSLFEECNSVGDCEYVGCRSDRECILAAARGLDGVGGGTGLGRGDDPRMFKCLPNDDDQFKTCKIPCENDGSCGQFQVCDAGYCKFVGCENDEECRAYLGIANEMTSEAKPYVQTAICTDEVN